MIFSFIERSWGKILGQTDSYWRKGRCIRKLLEHNFFLTIVVYRGKGTIEILLEREREKKPISLDIIHIQHLKDSYKKTS